MASFSFCNPFTFNALVALFPKPLKHRSHPSILKLVIELQTRMQLSVQS